MFSKETTKKALNEIVDAKMYQAFKDHDQNLGPMILKKLKTKDMDKVDIISLKLLIENHLSELDKEMESEKKKDIFQDSENIDDFMMDLSSMTQNKYAHRKDVFRNDFFDKQLEDVSSEISDLSDNRNFMILTYFENMKDWANSDIKKFTAVNLNQVYYDDLMDKYDQKDAKDNFTMREEGALALLKNHLHRETKFEPVRFIGDKRIALDFEEIGYHINTSHPVSELYDLVELEEQQSALKDKYQSIIDASKNSRNISFILDKLAESLEGCYGIDFTKSMIDNAKELSMLVASYADNSGNYDTQASIMEDIGDLVSIGEYSQIIEREVVQSLSAVSKSHEDIQLFCDEIRRTMFSHVSMDDIEDNFDENVKNVVELNQNGETLSFKREYKKLNVFERMAVDLNIREKEKANESDLSL